MTGEVAPRRALFFGDSLVAGVGDPGGGGWVARIVDACFARGVPLTPYNLGVRRETSIQVAARWRSEARPRIPQGADARIVISFGANDTTSEHGTLRAVVEDSRKALAGMLDEASAIGLPQFVVGPAPVDDREQNRRIEALTEVFAAVCDQRSVPFADVCEPLNECPVWMSEVAAHDGAHPGSEGYGKLAQVLIERGLLAWLTEPAASR